MLCRQGAGAPGLMGLWLCQFQAAQSRQRRGGDGSRSCLCAQNKPGLEGHCRFLQVGQSRTVFQQQRGSIGSRRSQVSTSSIICPLSASLMVRDSGATNFLHAVHGRCKACTLVGGGWVAAAWREKEGLECCRFAVSGAHMVLVKHGCV